MLVSYLQQQSCLRLSSTRIIDLCPNAQLDHVGPEQKTGNAENENRGLGAAGVSFPEWKRGYKESLRLLLTLQMLKGRGKEFEKIQA